MQRSTGIGTRYGHLVIVDGPTGREKKVHCKCDCGGMRTVPIRDLWKVERIGGIAHCTQGCKLRVNPAFSHGMTGTPQHYVWQDMVARCTRPTHHAYAYYGGRGITHAESWADFAGFWADMAEGYAPGLTLERIDNNAGYCRENCKWATRQEQSSNRRNNHYVETLNGKLTVAEAARIAGINESSMRERIAKGWPKERILIPVQPRGMGARRKSLIS